MERLFMNISSIDKIKALLIQLNSNKLLLADESDEDDDSRPARKRRLAERAAEGMEVEDDQV